MNRSFASVTSGKIAGRTGEIILRIGAAVIGGYALAIAASACLSLVLPMARAEAVLIGLMVSFLTYSGAVLWVFAVKSLRRMCLGIGGTIAGFSGLWGLLSPGFLL
ncbi:DUF3649 domain-containing protein [Marivibrio halodurans]|uniref:DUF3649 domain-containing protein n=1 Tax=Marivibrio halodurans TaxID=2039722 RepID=A0A8J7V235_9PROT|nr:DUF3649 domain-containing protein [Marivibrio halodurans]MBP5856452.1 DUF3649 domain-containing protein [Marivibrio halodurans]